MNKLVINSAIAILAFIMVVPALSYSQESKVHIKTVKEVDGKKIITDTVFTVHEGEHKGDNIKQFTWSTSGDSSVSVTYDVDIDSDYDVDVDDEHVIIMKKGHHGNTYFSNDNEKKYKIKIVSDGDGEENVFIIDDGDIDFESFEDLKISMKEYSEELKNLKIDIDGENFVMLKDLENLEELVELELLEELDELKNIEILTSDFHDVHGYYDFNTHSSWGHNVVSDKELRDAGISNKPDRLDVEDLNIDIVDGVVDVDFTTITEGALKVTVFNFFGERVFSGKPELMNGKYTIKMDLSAKQHGEYYMQVGQKNASITKKFKL